MRFYIISAIILLFYVVSCQNKDGFAGDRYFNNGEYQKAIDAYNDYLSKNPANVATLYNRGRAYEEIKQYENAEKDFYQVLEMDERNAQAYLSLAKIKYDQGGFQQAVLYGEKAIENNNANAQAYFITARAKHQLGFMNEAMEYYTLAIKLNANFGLSYLYRGAVKTSLNQMRGACDDFKKAKNLDTEGADQAINKYCN